MTQCVYKNTRTLTVPNKKQTTNNNIEQVKQRKATTKRSIMMSRNQRGNKKSTRIVAMTIIFLLLIGILSYLFLLSKIHTKLNQESPSDAAATTSTSTSTSTTTNIQHLQDRIQYLETKVNSYLAYTSDPFLSTRTPVKCKNMEFIKNIACKDKDCALDNQSICLDDFPNVFNIDGLDNKDSSSLRNSNKKKKKQQQEN
jgi:hypothetical protein